MSTQNLKILLSTLLTTLYIFANAQGGFKKKYFLQNAYMSNCREVIEAPNGNFILSGIVNDSSGTVKLTILGADAQGNLLWQKDYTNPNFEYIDNDLHLRAPILKDGNYFYHALCARISGGRQIGILIKFDFNGDTIWQKTYRDVDSLEDVLPQGITKSTDGGLLLTGFFQNWSSSPYSKCLIIKTDINGNELWRKKIGKSPPDLVEVQDGQSIVQDSATKNIIIVGYQYLGNGTYSNILILDSSGNKIVQTTFNNGNGGGFSEVIQLKDKNFLTCGAINTFSTWGNFQRTRGFVVKFNIAGGIIWSKSYDVPSPFNSVTLLHELQSGDLILGGYLDTLANSYIDVIPQIRIIKTDKDGNVKWKKIVGSAYSDETAEYVRSMNPTNDGGFILAAWNAFMTTPHPYSIIKIDSIACDTLAEWCRSVALDVSEFERSFGWHFDIYPNPSSKFIHLSAKIPLNKNLDIEVNDITGRLIEKFRMDSEPTKLDVSNYKEGVYLLNIIYEGRVIESKRLIVNSE